MYIYTEISFQLGSANVQFVERRIMFGQTPINLTTTRTALLANTGQNHGYFQVFFLLRGLIFFSSSNDSWTIVVEVTKGNNRLKGDNRLIDMIFC